MGSFVGRDHIARGFPGPVGITIAEADGPRDGIHPIHYSIVIVAAVGIGLFLPPIGVGLFIACSIADLSVDRATRAMLPFVLVLSIGLLIIVLVPWITLVLPRVFTYSDLTGAR